jgi:lipid II:glycine glycyltransferase (peptidoglycan interpeptide bridge formation enzyme)
VRVPSENASTLFIEHSLGGGYSYWYAPHGPLCTPDNATLGAWTQLVRRHIATTSDSKLLFIRIDPLWSVSTATTLTHTGFVKTTSQQPEQTILIDVTKKNEELLACMEHDLRYALRVADRRGVTVRTCFGVEERRKQFEVFWELFTETNQRHGLRTYPRAYYENLATLDDNTLKIALFFAEREGSVIATALVAFCGESAAYLYAGSRAGCGKYNAPSAILWNAFHAARSLNCRSFDLWGVSDTNPRWRGVTAFKRSFKGNEVSCVGTWDYPYSRIAYSAYKTARACLGTIRKVF